MTPSETAAIYYGACDLKGYKGNDGQLRTWRQQLGYAEAQDLEKALELYWKDNTEFPMPSQLRSLVERSRRERLEVSDSPKELVEYVCPECQAPFSTYVEIGDRRNRICAVVNEKHEIKGCRVRLEERRRTLITKQKHEAYA